jgi:hypothetical protein
MKQLTMRQAIRDAQKNRNAAIVILNAVLMLVILVCRGTMDETWFSKILIAISFVSYVVVMIAVLRAGSKITDKHLSVQKDICVSQFKEVNSFSTELDSNFGRSVTRYTLTFARIGEVPALPSEHDAIVLGKEYYILTFAHNRDIAKFYPTDEWELDEALLAKLHMNEHA